MLKETLTKFLVLHGVIAALVVQENGEIIESMQSGFSIDKNIGRVISIVARDSGTFVPHGENIPIPMIFVEYADNLLIVGPLIEEFYLVIIAKSTANIGLITLDMKNHRNAIVSQL